MTKIKIINFRVEIIRMLWYLSRLKMIINCEQCGAKFKIKSKKRPGEKATFKCGKCDNLIRVVIEDSLESTDNKLENTGEKTQTANTTKVECDKCGNQFIKPAGEKDTTCYQCRIDFLVNKIKDKYGVDSKPAPEAEEDSSKYTVRSADGLVLGPIKLRTVKVLAREKKIRGVEEVSKDGGEFIPLMEFSELAELFPDMKEIMDTSGLDDKVDEAFMAVFVEGEEELVKEGIGLLEDKEKNDGTDEQEPVPKADIDDENEDEPEDSALSEETVDLDDIKSPGLESEDKQDESFADSKDQDDENISDETKNLSPEENIEEESGSDKESEKSPDQDDESSDTEIIEPKEREEVDDEYLIDFNSSAEKEEVEDYPIQEDSIDDDVGTEFSFGDEDEAPDQSEEDDDDDIIEDLEPLPDVPEDARYRIRYPDGLILGPVKLATIVELHGDGNLTGQEDIQRENEDWVSFGDLPELAELLEEYIEDDDVVELTEILEEPA